jgi:SlyX protein
MLKNESISERLIALEEKLLHQEDTIDSLNEIVAKQDKEIQNLWSANRLLKQSISEAKPDSYSDAEPPPPHY